MKKCNKRKRTRMDRILAVLLTAIGISLILPMDSVQALKRKPVMRLEIEAERESEAEEEEKKETAKEAIEETAEETEKQEETKKIETEAEKRKAEETADCIEDKEPETEKTAEEISPTETKEGSMEPGGKKEPQLLIPEKVVSFEIYDIIDKELCWQDDRYVKRVTHSITIINDKANSPNASQTNMVSDIYEDISYTIYQKTSEGEILLKEDSLDIPYQNEERALNKIEILYTQGGDYCIRVKGKRQWKSSEGEKEVKEEELICHDFSIPKDTQQLQLGKKSITLDYGDIFYFDTHVEENTHVQSEYEIKEESGDKNKILEIGKVWGNDYIKAVGINSADKGTTSVKVRLKETEFMEASNEETITVYVNPMELDMKAEVSASEVYMYDTLAVKVMLQSDEKNITKELFDADKNLSIGFTIASETDSCEINAEDLKCEKGDEYTFYIPVRREYFENFSKGAKYSISASLKYSDTQNQTGYLPYKANTVTKNVELLGRKAKMKLSADCDGIYDYRTYYRGVQPNLWIEIEDTTTLPNEENNAEQDAADQKALVTEAGDIVYSVSSEDNSVVAVDSSKKYTAADGRIPLCINGAGATKLTVTAGGSSVYTVESSTIEITVKNSPLYDEDFVISVMSADKTKEQSFKGDAKQTGFEKWQEYLSAHGSWINGNVAICLTETGLKYYNILRLEWNGKRYDASKQILLNDDSKITTYIFGAANGETGADTAESGDKENGTRSFQMGIDMTPPVVISFIPPSDYYSAASTEEKQYFPQSFILKGSFTDATSGIAAIEYTTDMTAGNGTEWKPLENFKKAEENGSFKLVLKNGSYNAIAVRAVDMAGNVSEAACLKNENGDFIKIIVDDTPPDIDVSAMLGEDDGDWQEYSAENENWTNRKITFQVSEKVKASETEDTIVHAGLFKVEYAYQSIAAVLRNEPVGEDEWQELTINEHGIAEFSVGGDFENPTNKNGCYYFRGVSEAGVKNEINTEERILLWQKMAVKKPVLQSGADPGKCHNEWYNKASGTPVIDFEYPEYDTGVSSDEYAAPVTIHYSLSVRDEKDITTTLADNKTATIRAYTPKDAGTGEAFAGFPLVSDDLSELQAVLSEDGIYTLEYWTTDAAGNESETEILTYKIDCHEPTGLKITLAGEEQMIGNESTLIYEKFYQNSVSGEATADYGISGKDSIKLLKAKKTGEWKNTSPAEAAEQFQIEPNMRCLLYVRAVDGAGNMTEGWTKGIVADNEAPVGNGTPKLIIEPEGANRHGFFNKDVKVKISIKDAPEDGNSAGLKLVTGFMGTDGADTISNKELFSSTEESVSEQLLAETESVTLMETINAKANEGNHAYITINALDRSGNMSTDTREVKIDVTKPEIEITFDNENAANGRYYNADRRAKITIRELNFDSSLVDIKVRRNGEAFTPSISDWKSDKNNHYAYVDFSADGDYTLTVECMDLADNKAEKESAEPFTIDKTMPRVNIALENVNAQNGYFNETQTAVITVTEHNFNADEFQIHIQPEGKTGAWEHKNDTHVIKVELSTEGEYEISCDYRDLAGNGIAEEDKSKMPLAFVVDKTSPVIAISGVEDNSANAGEVIPNIIIQDINIEPAGTAITLTTGRGEAMDIGTDITVVPAESGFLYTLNGLDAKQDDIYYLTVNAADKAGNISELTYRFSLNRRGSAYDLTELTKLVDSYYNSYNTLEDIKIVEMNVDKVEEFALYLSYNADIVYGKTGSRPSDQNENKLPEAVIYSRDVSGSEDTGYVYTYTIYRENFALEGTYRLGVYSKDRAGNEVNNLLKHNGEEIQFVIDKTLPRVVIDGVENNEIYDVESQEVRVVADDNFKLAEAELMLVNKDGEMLEHWNYFDLVEKEGDTALITIGEHKEEVSLLYRAVDAAGNEVQILQGEKTAKADFLVTTDKFVQLVNKPTKSPIGRVIITALVISIMGVLLILASFKRVSLKQRK